MICALLCETFLRILREINLLLHTHPHLSTMPLFEICAVNLQSAIAAQAAGANRIELCSALDVGGLTPSIGLLRAAVKAIHIPVYVLIRPREGDFCYTPAEVDLMAEDIRFCRENGARGVVIGALDRKGRLDVEVLEHLCSAAQGLDVTCHRAFDMTPDAFESLDTLIGLGINRVLSSGQAPDAYEGRHRLAAMVRHAAARISIMPGSGIHADNIQAIAAETGAQEFHFTGKIKAASTYEGHGLPGLENWHWESDVATIKKIMNAHV
jgi:copper homeostasis protein